MNDDVIIRGPDPDEREWVAKCDNCTYQSNRWSQDNAVQFAALHAAQSAHSVKVVRQ